MNELLRYREEFDDDFAVPVEVETAVLLGELLDTSWHNDVSPSFKVDEDSPFTLWIDHPDAEMREYRRAKRFTITFDVEEVWSGEDVDARTALDELKRCASNRSR
jgi:hypothetical protein